MTWTAPLSFETVLRRTRPPADSDGGETGVHSVRSMPWYLPETGAGRAMPHDTAGDWVATHYSSERPRQHPADEGCEPPPALQSLDPQAIARELALADCDSIAALRLRRRQFARANHPDRVKPALSAHATERMMTANRLIDQEIARREGIPRKPR